MARPKRTDREAERLLLIGGNIQKFRKELKIGRAMLAGMVGVDEATIRRYEQGKTAAPYATMKALAGIFGRPVEHLDHPDPPPVKRPVRWVAQCKVSGNPPAGLQDELEAVIAKYRQKFR